MNRPVNGYNVNLKDAFIELIERITEPLAYVDTQIALLCADIQVYYCNSVVDHIVLLMNYTDEEYNAFLHSLSNVTEEDDPIGVAYFSDGSWAIFSESTWDWYYMATPEVPEYLKDRTLPIADFDNWVVYQSVL